MLFRGLARAHGTYRLFSRATGGKKITGDARTVREPVTDKLWEMHLQGVQGLGVIPITDEAICFFAAIDIDKYDLNLKDLEAQCARLGLPCIPTRTKSGGCHLYVFFPLGVPASLARARLAEWAVALGYAGAEIFPKQNSLYSEEDVGNWINMPYFGVHGGTTDRYGIFKGEPLSLEEFVNRAEKLAVTKEQLEQLVLAPADSEDFESGPPCLQSLARSGFSMGSRNSGLFAIGVYLRKRFPDEWQDRMRFYNAKFMKPALNDAEVKTIVKSLTRKKYNYNCDEPPCKNFCNRTLCQTREFGIGKGIDEWGVVIDRKSIKVMTEPPFWLITVNEKRMKLFSEDMINQRRFQQICIERIGYLPPTIDASKWRGQVNEIMQNAIEAEAPHDASVVGELSFHLRQFCTVFPQAETKEEITVGKPYTEDGVTYFRAADFRKYLDLQHFRALTGTPLYAELRELGLEYRNMRFGDKVFTVWAVKAYDESAPEVPARSIKSEGDM
jgi:hypothetical protein